MCAIGDPSGPIENGDVHRAALHAVGVQAREFVSHFGWVTPVIIWSGLIFGGGADVGAVFDSGNIAGVECAQYELDVLPRQVS